MLDMTGLEELWLGEDTEQLLFQNKGPDDCTIHAPEDGSGLTLQFIGEYRPHTELPNLWGLHGIQLKDFDLTALVDAHPHLKELRLWGAPGNLGNFSAVQEFRELTNLSTFDLFGYGADDIPTPEQMPELRWFWMTSLSEDMAKATKQLWKGKPGMGPADHQARKPEWLAQNLDNPFRGWERGSISCRRRKKAASQYRKTRSQLVKRLPSRTRMPRPRRWMPWPPTPRLSTRWALSKPWSGTRSTWLCGIFWMLCQTARFKKKP